MKKGLNVKKIAITGILTALSVISFVIEGLFPPLIIPGARLGVSNVFILLTLILAGAPYAFFAVIIKCLIGSLFSGNISAIMYSLPAGIVAVTVETLLCKFYNRFSIVSASASGGILSLTIQNLVFCLITNSVEYLYYLPYLSLIGAVSGVAVGFIVYLIIKFIPDGLIQKLYTYRRENLED